jgi:hypothetical protein
MRSDQGNGGILSLSNCRRARDLDHSYVGKTQGGKQEQGEGQKFCAQTTMRRSAAKSTRFGA